MQNRVCIGEIIAAHGLKGHVKVKTFTEDPSDLISYGQIFSEDGTPFDITITAHQPNNLLINIQHINNRDAAELLKGTKLFVDRDQLPHLEKGYYYHDLIGMRLKLTDGTDYGHVKDMVNYGAGDIIEITRENGKEEMFSFNDTCVVEVDLDNKIIIFDPPEIVEVSS